MLLSPHRFRRPIGPRVGDRPAVVALGLFCAVPVALGSGLAPAAAQQSGYGQTMGSTPVESQIYNYDPASGGRTGSGSGGLNPTNPLDLFNKIRKSTAMDDATPPADAIDQALKELEAQSRPQPASKPASPVVVSPLPGGAAAATP